MILGKSFAPIAPLFVPTGIAFDGRLDMSHTYVSDYDCDCDCDYDYDYDYDSDGDSIVPACQIVACGKDLNDWIRQENNYKEGKVGVYATSQQYCVIV